MKNKEKLTELNERNIFPTHVFFNDELYDDSNGDKWELMQDGDLYAIQWIN